MWNNGIDIDYGLWTSDRTLELEALLKEKLAV